MRWRLLALACLLTAAACSGEKEFVPSPLYRTVPSDAVEVFHFNDCASSLASLLDSTDLFRNIDFEAYSSSEMVLSYSYAAKLIPLLAVDLGPETVKESVDAIIDMASANGVKSSFFSASASGIGRAVLLMSTSEVVLATAAGHIAAGTSILDANGFAEAVELAGESSGSIILRSSFASRFIPRKMLGGLVPRKDLVRAVSGLSQWTVLAPSGEGEYDVKFVTIDSRHSASFIDGLSGAASELDGVLPGGTDFCIDLPMKSYRDYVRCYETFLDARSSLDKLKNVRRSLSVKAGKTVERWASDQDILEIATIRWENRELNLIFSAVSSSSPSVIAPGLVDPLPNVYAGFPAALFGQAFFLKDESHCARWGAWTVSGSQDDVKAFLDCMDRIPVLKWSGKDIKFAICSSSWLVMSRRDEVKLDVYD